MKSGQALLRLVLNTTLDGYILADSDGRIVDVNPAYSELVGFSRDELLTKNIREMEAVLSEQEIRDRIETMLRDGGARFETRHRHRDGHEIDLDVNIAIMEIEEKPLVAAFVRDISDRKKVEGERDRLRDQLVQAQKMESVGRLAGGVAHDFNNMLSAILGHVELALGQTDAAQPLFENLDAIRVAAERSAGLTAQLLAFARKQAIVPETLDLNRSVAGMLDLLRPLIGEDIDLAWMPGEDVWPIEADPSQIHQILANLCVNARDAIDDVGNITVETGNAVFDGAYCAEHATFVPGEFAMLAVSDDGIGMDAATLGNVFEPYFTTKGSGEGTGLGLATVYGIVKQHNGFINVYSEPGEGTTFRIYLPRFVGEIPAIRKARRSRSPVGGDETILVVEDEAIILKMTGTMLGRLGYAVIPASKPSEAIALAETHSGDIHLLITDVIMPEMNGRELVDRLRTDHSHLKCLYMSGYTANVIAHRGVLAADVNFIQKPFSKTDLAAKVRDALESD